MEFLEERSELRRKECVDEFIRWFITNYLDQGKNITNVNVISLLYKTFVEAGIEAVRFGVVENYISLFTRSIVRELYVKLNAFDCKHYVESFKQINNLFEEIKKSLIKNFDIFDTNITTISRMLVHTRSHHLPLEVSITWDYVFNVPFIPASTLKGVARAYCEASNTFGIKGISCSELFGSQNKEGLIIFTDAYPIKCNDKLIEPDVITPTYSETEGAIDEVSASPTPIVFLTMAPKVTFKNLLLIARSREKDIESNLINIIDNVRKAFEIGVGAKTSIGYGRVIIQRGERKNET